MGRFMPTIADVIIESLQDAGVRTLFGVPGGAGNLDLIAAAGRARLRFVLTATETAAAIAAVAQTEVTGQLGACFTTLGPGAASVTNGVACAFLERAPVLVFTDSHGSPAFEHQRVSQSELFAPITNASFAISAANARTVMETARARALSPRPGPVHIDCPGTVLSTAAPTPAPEKDVGCNFGQKRHPTSFSKRKPLLLLGVGARAAGDAAAIRVICDRFHVPAMVTYKAKGVVPDDHPWFAGVYTNGAIEQPLIDQADLLIGLGLDPVELLPRAWTGKPPIVYAGPWAVEDKLVPFAEQFVAPLEECVSSIEARLNSSDWSQAEVRAFAGRQREAVSIGGDGLTAQRVVELAAEPFAGSSRVTVDAGAHMFPATILWPVSNPNDMLISNGLSTMGFALPAAIGAALADPSRPVVVLTGDGGLLMCAGELLTAVRERLRIIVIVFNDASLSLIEIKQQARRLPAAGVALGAVDWCALAAGFGMPSYAASTEDGFVQSLEAAAQHEGPVLIEAKIDRSNYGATMRAIRG
jgi:acetolactate synthase-1/2/3 large subunit